MGKEKQRRAGVATKSGVEAVAPQRTAMGVGMEVLVTADYLDMEKVPEDNGLAHCGYLVLRTGEKLRILYTGSAETGDGGWLYGEVILSLQAEPVGRRGWLPSKVVGLLPAAPPAAGGVITKAAAGSAGPPPPPAQNRQPA